MATYDEVFAESLEYFKGDELAASVFATKYALQDEEGNFLETNPDQMHKRLASEFARVEAKYDMRCLKKIKMQRTSKKSKPISKMSKIT